MTNTDSPPILRSAAIVYLVMTLAACGLAWWLEIDLWRTRLSETSWRVHVVAFVYGLVGALPLVGLLLLFERHPPRALARLKQSVDEHIVPLLDGLPLWQFALLSLCAGVGEEALFRGVLQQWLEAWLPAQLPGGPLVLSIAIAGVAFGACHWINDQYALVAALVGMYLGMLLVASGHLLAPMTTHAVYDFFALSYLVTYRVKSTS